MVARVCGKAVVLDEAGAVRVVFAIHVKLQHKYINSRNVRDNITEFDAARDATQQALRSGVQTSPPSKSDTRSLGHESPLVPRSNETLKPSGVARSNPSTGESGQGPNSKASPKCICCAAPARRTSSTGGCGTSPTWSTSHQHQRCHTWCQPSSGNCQSLHGVGSVTRKRPGGTSPAGGRCIRMRAWSLEIYHHHGDYRSGRGKQREAASSSNPPMPFAPTAWPQSRNSSRRGTCGHTTARTAVLRHPCGMSRD